jgi:hypothetical protein
VGSLITRRRAAVVVALVTLALCRVSTIADDEPKVIGLAIVAAAAAIYMWRMTLASLLVLVSGVAIGYTVSLGYLRITPASSVSRFESVKCECLSVEMKDGLPGQTVLVDHIPLTRVEAWLGETDEILCRLFSIESHRATEVGSSTFEPAHRLKSSRERVNVLLGVCLRKSVLWRTSVAAQCSGTTSSGGGFEMFRSRPTSLASISGHALPGDRLIAWIVGDRDPLKTTHASVETFAASEAGQHLVLTVELTRREVRSSAPTFHDSPTEIVLDPAR